MTTSAPHPPPAASPAGPLPGSAAGFPPGPLTRRRIWPWIVGGVFGTVLVALLAVGVANWALRTAEMRGLVTAIEASEQQMVIANDELTALATKFGEAQTWPQRQEALAELGRVSGERADAVAAAGRSVADVRIAPWNLSVERARTAYLAHNASWVDFLRTGASDPASLFQKFDAIEQTWNALRQPLRRAVPWPDPFNLLARVDALLAGDDPPADDGSGAGAGAGQSAALR